jgi:succinate dehydrogenase/fumarate reductase cytochrome b subunit
MFRVLHRTSALLLGVFIIMHLLNHAMLFAGVERHIAFMEIVRPFYRGAMGQAVLLSLIGWQMGSGALLLWRARSHIRGAVPMLQAGSGAVILLFLLVHVSAVLSGQIAGVDTNIYFAVAGYYNGMAWFFGPYYWFAIMAVFTHVGCALYWAFSKTPASKPLLLAMLSIGSIFASLMTVQMAGWINPIDVPIAYLRPIKG